jgi:DNA gyrase subunit A
VILVTERGQSARFNVDVLREASRVSGGVRGIRLTQSDHLAAMDVVEPDAQLLVVTSNGFGKRTPLSAYPTKGRGIGGVRAIKTTPKTGPVKTARVVRGYEELMLVSANGIVIRTAIETISERAGRSTSGVILMRVGQGDEVAAIAVLEPSPNGDNGGDAEVDAAAEPDGDTAPLADEPASADDESGDDESDDDEDDEPEGAD